MIKIISDSSCDLPRELIEKYNIDILPLHIHLNDEEYEDGVNITPAKIFAWADENKTTPKTSVFAINEVINIFEKYSNDELICFSISSSMSSSYNVMRLAAEELEIEDRVHLIDSQNLSTGISLLILETAKMINEGKEAKEIVEKINELIPKVRTSFVVDTLTYLHRGGRCSSVAAISGSMLNIHPKIIVKDGKMTSNKKYRGRMSSVIMKYAEDLEEELKNAIPENVFITYSGNKDISKEAEEYIRSLGIFKNIYKNQAGSVISSHCGPGTLGILFIEK